MDAVEPQQVRIGGDGAEIVDGDDFDVGPARFVDGAQHVASDPPEPVDRNLHSHLSLSETNIDFEPRT